MSVLIEIEDYQDLDNDVKKNTDIDSIDEVCVFYDGRTVEIYLNNNKLVARHNILNDFSITILKNTDE